MKNSPEFEFTSGREGIECSPSLCHANGFFAGSWVHFLTALSGHVFANSPWSWKFFHVVFCVVI